MEIPPIPPETTPTIPPASAPPPDEPPEDNLRKYRLAALYSAVFLAVVLIVCLCLWGFRLITDSPESRTSSQSSSAAAGESSSSPAYTRILGQWEGKLALFSGNQAVPDEVFDVFIVSLPQEEQDKLREGISIHDETELARYLEDYTS